ncbi:GDP-mannose 4,6-dehydratase [candidate division KSB1 bacterium]|nr:GDP-mannose 4,6-dehydratase [candidate division KSB1 bacterium]
MMMKLLVTGGAGFIGSHLIESLLKHGNHVSCLDDFNNYYTPSIKWNNISQFQNHTDFKLFEGDIRDTDLLEKIFRADKFDCIVHLAARAGVRPSLKEPMLYQDVNIKGTMNLLEMAKQHHIEKFIFASSSSVYGNNKKVPFAEDDFVDHPISPYAATKRMGEIICYTYHHLYQISITCLRFFTVYGPRQRPDMAIHRFTRLIHDGEKIPMYGDGSSKRDYTFISDIIQGINLAIEKCSGYNIYNLGESKTIQLRELIQLIARNVGTDATIERLPMQPGDVDITFADIQKARAELGYAPSMNMEQGIADFVKWFKEHASRA